MPEQKGKSPFSQVTIEAVVIRADGTREDFGTVSYWHKNPLRRLIWRLRHGNLRR